MCDFPWIFLKDGLDLNLVHLSVDISVVSLADFKHFLCASFTCFCSLFVYKPVLPHDFHDILDALPCYRN